MTAEYRRGLIRVTFAATPRRGRVLAAKAVVIAAVTFAAGLVSATVVVAFGQRVLRDHGVYVWPATALTELRVIVGTAAVLAVAAVIALALGTVLRRGAVTVAVVIVVMVLPYLLTVTTPLLLSRADRLAGAGHPGRGVRRAADPDPVPAGRQRLHAVGGLLAARHRGRAWRCSAPGPRSPSVSPLYLLNRRDA